MMVDRNKYKQANELIVVMRSLATSMGIKHEQNTMKRKISMKTNIISSL